MISIIVGCFNVAKWLLKGRLNNIYNQSFRDWELILVDDGSTDETSHLIDEEAKNDDRIKVIHKENGGLGSARNAGLDIAQGKYIWSFDVDDEVDSDVLEKLYNIAETTDAEMLCFGYVEYNTVLKTRIEHQFDRISCHSNDEVRSVYLDHLLLKFNNGFFWNKLYRRDFIEKYHLRFGNERIQQDEVFNLNVYKYVNHLELIPGSFYHYYVYNAGNNRSRFIPDRFEIYKSVHEHFCDLRDFWGLAGDARFDAFLNNRLFVNLNDLLRNNLTHPRCQWRKKECQAEITRVMNDKDFRTAIEYMEKRGLNFENRLFLWAYRRQSIEIIKTCNYIFEQLRTIKRGIL